MFGDLPRIMQPWASAKSRYRRISKLGDAHQLSWWSTVTVFVRLTCRQGVDRTLESLTRKMKSSFVVAPATIRGRT
jgi:hypothetical protein